VASARWRVTLTPWAVPRTRSNIQFVTRRQCVAGRGPVAVKSLQRGCGSRGMHVGVVQASQILSGWCSSQQGTARRASSPSYRRRSTANDEDCCFVPVRSQSQTKAAGVSLARYAFHLRPPGRGRRLQRAAQPTVADDQKRRDRRSRQFIARLKGACPCPPPPPPLCVARNASLILIKIRCSNRTAVTWHGGVGTSPKHCGAAIGLGVETDSE
jgi:hypothetical protein